MSDFIDENGGIIDPYRNFIALSRYARWSEELGRRETWSETVERYNNFFQKYLDEKYPLAEIDLSDEISGAILNHEVMPSMRSLMTAGPALERDAVAGYNCSFLGVDHPRAFDEAMYILMCGTGVGFSVESKYIDKLPLVNEHFEKTDTTIVVADSKAGWARALRELLALLWQGQIPSWDMSRVRPSGERLKTFGGRASGPEPLDRLFKFCVEIFKSSAGRKLKPIEAHDIMCKIGEVVVVGGVRRSAMISLSNLEDYDMAKAKAGSWWDTNGQRALSNNSAVYESQPSVGEFLKEWRHLYDSKSGERGIFSLDNAQRTAASSGRRDGSKVMGTNPSLVAGTLVWTDSGIRPIEQLQGKEFKVTNLEGGESDAVCWKSGENVPIHGVVVTGGHRYLATGEHKWPVLRKNEWVRVRTLDLKPGDILPNIERNSLYPEGKDFIYTDGFLIGWNIGSGERFSTVREKSKIRYHYIIDEDIRDYVVPRLDRGLYCIGTATKIKKILRHKSENLNSAEIYGEPLRKLFKLAGDGEHYKGLPSVVWDSSTSEEFRKGLIDAIISSSAYFDSGHDRLTVINEHERVIRELSSLLGFYGIKTSVERVGESVTKPKDRARVFALHVIGGKKDLSRLVDLFPLSNKKLEREVLNHAEDTDYPEPFASVNVLEVNRNVGRQDVWDVTVYDWSHAFQLDHCVTGNCGEILLRNKGFCNLSEVVVAAEDTLDDLKRKVRIATIIGTIQSTMTDFKYLRKAWKFNAEDERLLGVSLTGQFGHPVLSGSAGKEKLRLWLREMKNVAVQTNLDYSEKLGISQSAAITTVKPSGCRPKDALTVTNDGILTLEELLDLSCHPDGEEWSDLHIEGPTGKITKTYDNGVSEVLAIDTDYGVELRSTPNHHWSVVDKGWTRADELVRGDVIESKFGTYDAKKNLCLYSEDGYPSDLLPDVSWLLSMIASTSEISENGNVRVFMIKKDTLDQLRVVLKTHFGINAEVIRDRKLNRKFSLEIDDPRFIPWLKDNGLVDFTGPSREIPLAVRVSSRESIIAYLAGLSDGYGVVSGHTARSFIYVDNEDYARHIQSVSWAVGINLFRGNNLFRGALGNAAKSKFILGTTSASNYDDIETFRKYFVRGSGHYIWLCNENSTTKGIAGRVRSVESLGEMNTYDIEVEGSHYYFDGAFKSHNTVSQLTSVSSGMHPWHSEQYIRSVRGDNKDPLTEFLKSAGLPNEPDVMKPLDTTVFYFPVNAPENSITRNDITAIEHLEIWKIYKQNWTEHNPSITVTVREHEWVDVAAWVYSNWDDIGGISFLPHSDHTYKQAPYQEVSSEEFAEFLTRMPDRIYWDELSFYESEDMTTGSQELACSAGACDIIEIGSVSSDES